jgi:hypothetical protein
VRRADNSAVLHVSNVKVSLEVQHSILPLSLHALLRENFTLSIISVNLNVARFNLLFKGGVMFPSSNRSHHYVQHFVLCWRAKALRAFCYSLCPRGPSRSDADSVQPVLPSYRENRGSDFKSTRMKADREGCMWS